jgi:hypothetical protein
VKVPFTWKVTGWFMVGWPLDVKGYVALRKWAPQFYEEPASPAPAAMQSEAMRRRGRA